MSTLDQFLPAFQFREVHRRGIPASAEAACRAVPHVDLAQSPFIGPLFALRSLPARLSGRGPVLGAGTLGAMLHGMFVPLLESPTALVFGAAGQFWRTSGGARKVSRESFAGFAEPGCARLAWSFEFTPRGPHACEAVTETRIQCSDATALRSMRLYWLLIRPASGLIRREILRLLARTAASDHGPARVTS